MPDHCRQCRLCMVQTISVEECSKIAKAHARIDQMPQLMRRCFQQIGKVLNCQSGAKINMLLVNRLHQTAVHCRILWIDQWLISPTILAKALNCKLLRRLFASARIAAVAAPG